MFLFRQRQEAAAAAHEEEEEDPLPPLSLVEEVVQEEQQEEVASSPPPLSSLSKHHPTLSQCFSALATTDSLHELLSSLLNQEQGARVCHLQDWLLFLVACILAPPTTTAAPPPSSSFDQEKQWCDEVLLASAGNKVCPKAFGTGEIVWNCEQCQRDSTCVQCAQCFAQSNHEGHTVYFYQVTTASGGCCDCGDVDAWDPSGFCPHHGQAAAAAASSSSHAQERDLRRLFDWIANWMLESCHQLGSKEADAQYVGKFELSSYIRGLDYALPRLAEMERGMPDDDEEDEDEIRISAADLLACRVAQLVESCTTICKSSDALVRVLVQSLTAGSAETEQEVARLFLDGTSLEEGEDVHKEDESLSVLEGLISLDPLIPPIVSQAFHGFFMRLLLDATFKQRYAIGYAKTLVRTSENAKDRVERALSDIALPPQYHNFEGFLLSIQFLNRPRVVHVLCRRFGLLDSLVRSLELLMLTGDGVYDSSNPVLRQRVYRYAMSDFKYVLQIEGMSKLFFEQDEGRLLDRWLVLLQRVQSCDAERRIPVGQPAVDDTDEWIHSTYATFNLSLLFPHLTAWMVADKKQLTRDMSVRIVATCERFLVHETAALRPLADDEFSFFLPLYRFIALCLDFQLSLYGAEDHLLSREASTKLLHASCRVLALSSMVALGAWKRNGIGMHDRNTNYERTTLSFYTRDLDLKSVQFAMRELGADEVLRFAFQEFGLLDPTVDYGVGMFASFFQLVIALVEEMPCHQGQFSWDLDRMLVHKLSESAQPLHVLGEAALVPWSREVDCTKLPGDDDFLVERVQRVAVLRPHSDLQSAVYELKPEMWHELYDPNYVHQQREAREVAQERWAAARAKRQKDGGGAPSSVLLPICPALPVECHQMFVRCRQELLAAALPLATSALAKCIESDQIASTLALVSVQVITLYVHCGGGGEGVPAVHDELVQVLRQCAQTSPFDKVVMDGLRWVLDRLSPPPVSHNDHNDDGDVMEIEPPSLEEEDTENPIKPPRPPASTKPSALSSSSSTTMTTTPQDKLDKKRLRAQEKAMKAMRKASMAFGAEMAAAEEASSSPTSGPMPPAVLIEEEAAEEEDEYACTCMMQASTDSNSRTALMGFLGLQQTSQAVLAINCSSSSSSSLASGRGIDIVSLCGHAMHQSCCDEWKRSAPQGFGTAGTVEDRARGEFLCPLCKSVCNVWVPFSPQAARAVSTATKSTSSGRTAAAPLLSFHSLPSFTPFNAGREASGGSVSPAPPRTPSLTALAAATATAATGGDEETSFDFIQDFEASCTRNWQGMVASFMCHPGEVRRRRKALLMSCVSLGIDPADASSSFVDSSQVEMLVPEVRMGVEFVNSLCRTVTVPDIEKDEQVFRRRVFVYCLGLKLVQVAATATGGAQEEVNDDDEDAHFLTSVFGPGAPAASVFRGEVSRFVRFHAALTLQQQDQDPVAAAASSPISLRTLFDNDSFRRFVAASSSSSTPPPQFTLRQLVALPTDYTTLLLQSKLDQPCTVCREVAHHERAVCLVCGETAGLMAGSNCFRNARGEGACTAHAKRAHAGVCVFYLVQRSAVLLISHKKSTLYSSLYLDKHGEERNGYNRGLPMKLDAGRVANVQAVFEQNRVPMEIASRSSRLGFVHDGYF